MRLDLFLSKKTGWSRHQIQKVIAGGGVKVEGCVVTKPSFAVRGEEKIDYTLPAPQGPVGLVPQNIPLEILYEDESIAVINKPADLVIHPAAGHRSQTLVNALLARYGNLPEGSERLKPGIVHRLDKGTSGCLVAARTEAAMKSLLSQFKNRSVEKIYWAVVAGRLPEEGIFDKPLGRHPKNRQKISSRTRKGREAKTEWKTLENFGRSFSWVEIRLHTGRTHQIRVHFAEGGHPVVGDPVYGRRAKTRLQGISRPMLHARRLGFTHPVSGEWMQFEAPLPQDINELLQNLKQGNIK